MTKNEAFISLLLRVPEVILEPGPSDIGFLIGIYLEHLEEASFLYEQRLGLIEDAEVTWVDLNDFDVRFESHVDGLYLGKDLALAVCKQQTTEGDAGELHVAMRVFCRHDKLDLALEVIEALDPEDDARILAVQNALAFELPDSWLVPLLSKYKDQGGIYRHIMPYVFGFQRRLVSNTLLPMLSSDQAANVIWAMGRVRETQVIQVLGSFHNLEPSAQQEASLALMRIGYSQVSTLIAKLIPDQTWALLHVGFCGRRADVNMVRKSMVEQDPSREGMLALGLLGDPVVVPFLIQHLEHETVAEAVSHALFLITGAEIIEETFVPEQIDEDELFEEELEALKNGESLYEPGEEPGNMLVRISQDIIQWKSWWEKNRGQYTTGLRYRYGALHAPASTLKAMKSEFAPNALRRLLYEELVITYALDVPFEVEMTVEEQLKAIARYEALIQENTTEYAPGKWYFAGRLTSEAT